MIPTAPNNPNECANYFPRRKTTCLNWLWEGKKEKQYGNAINGGRWSTCLPGGTAQRQVGTSTTSVVLLGFSKWGPFFSTWKFCARLLFTKRSWKDREKTRRKKRIPLWEPPIYQSCQQQSQCHLQQCPVVDHHDWFTLCTGSSCLFSVFRSLLQEGVIGLLNPTVL